MNQSLDCLFRQITYRIEEVISYRFRSTRVFKSW